MAHFECSVEPLYARRYGCRQPGILLSTSLRYSYSASRIRAPRKPNIVAPDITKQRKAQPNALRACMHMASCGKLGMRASVRGSLVRGS